MFDPLTAPFVDVLWRLQLRVVLVPEQQHGRKADVPAECLAVFLRQFTQAGHVDLFVHRDVVRIRPAHHVQVAAHVAADED